MEENMENENKIEEGIGEIQIANEVVASIAGISATEVDGVETMTGSLKNEIAGKFGVKNNAKGVKVVVNDSEAEIELAVTMKYGFSIPETCAKVQERVAQAVNSMTGLTCTRVNVTIVGVAVPKD